MGGWHFLGTYQEDDTHQNNGPIDHLTGILDTVVASAHEAEYGAAFVNGQCLYNTRLTLDDLGYPQPPTPLIMDNETFWGRRERAIFYNLGSSLEQGVPYASDVGSFPEVSEYEYEERANKK